MCEVSLSPWWRRRLAAAFAFPPLTRQARAVRGRGEVVQQSFARATDELLRTSPLTDLTTYTTHAPTWPPSHSQPPAPPSAARCCRPASRCSAPTIGGATLGAQIGALAGAFIDQALFAPSGQPRVAHGPRLSDLRVTASSEGAPIPRLYGRARLGGQIIWATDFEEEVVQQGAPAAAARAAPAGSAATAASIEYRYFANFAVALGEGPITGIGRVWADGTRARPLAASPGASTPAARTSSPDA